MKKDSKVGAKVKAQIGRFCSSISEGMNKSGRRFFGEVMYGILAAQDIKLSNIARTLGEAIALIKTENRLSRHMAQIDLTEMVNEAL
ncbi:MAG: hypothetical protein NT030_08080, partial [Candidatus Saganbacteria bacterium]|nr:hypothetical protein [Candidatus Saganbacteria bacterium]